jgi:hypothetical protein
VKALAILVSLASVALLPLAHATTLPACTDESLAASNGFYLYAGDGTSVWSERNDVPGLQTHDCLDGSGSFHHADVEEAGIGGDSSRQTVCLNASFCVMV